MRGPAVGGTERVHLVFFIDDWKQRIQWADYAQIKAGEIDGKDPDHAGKRPPIHLISVDLIRRLARENDSGSLGTGNGFLSFLPCGWFNVEFDNAVAGTDNSETVNLMILAYDHDKQQFDRFAEALSTGDLSGFEESEINVEAVSDRLESWQQEYFGPIEQQIGPSLQGDLLAVARHMAQNDREPPTFFPFEARQKHDLDRLAERALTSKLDRFDVEKMLREEFDNPEFFWKALFSRFEQFRTQFNNCTDRAIDRKGGRLPPLPPYPVNPEPRPQPEPSSEVKAQVLQRDGNKCVCCGSTRLLQVDHIKSRYRGGGNEPENLQLLCKVCNGLKETEEIDFRNRTSPLTAPPTQLPSFELRDLLDGGDLGEGRERLLRRWINFLYRCSAVEAIEAVRKDGKLRTTKIKLRPGLDRSWIGPHIERTIRIINSEPAHGESAESHSVTVKDDSWATGVKEDDHKSDSGGDIPQPPAVEETDNLNGGDHQVPAVGGLTTINDVLESIFEVEGFRVRISNRQGRRINGNWARGIQAYPYRNKLNEAKTVNAWKTTRFLPLYEAFDSADYFVEVLDSASSPCAGNTKLRTVRESYA